VMGGVSLGGLCPPNPLPGGMHPPGPPSWGLAGRGAKGSRWASGRVVPLSLQAPVLAGAGETLSSRRGYGGSAPAEPPHP